MEVNAILQAVETGLPAADIQLLQQQLQQHINYLINNDFDRLVQLLYTIDVDEKKLKTLLQQHQDTDAAEIISTMMIERHLQKAQTKAQFKKMADDDEAERW